MVRKIVLPPDDRLCLVLLGTTNVAGHHEPPHPCDLRSLRDGRKGNTGYSGRPGLTEQIVSDKCLRSLSVERPHSVSVWLWSFGYLWRALDKREMGNPYDRADTLATLVGPAWTEFMAGLRAIKETTASQIYGMCRSTVQEALVDSGSSHELPANPFRTTDGRSERRASVSPYDEATEAKLMQELRSLRHELVDRFDMANALADSGEEPATTLGRCAGSTGAAFKSIWTPSNTARLIRDVALPQLLNWADFKERFGFEAKKLQLPPTAPPVKLMTNVRPGSIYEKSFGTGNGLGALYRNFVPVLLDLVTFPVEVICAAGLNGQPTVDFDRYDWHERIGPDRVMMHTVKIRGGGNTISFSSGMGPDTPFGIVSSAIRITKPLHEYVLAELERLRSLPRSEITEVVEARIDELQSLERRVWLCLALLPLSVTALKSDTSPTWNMINMRLAQRGVTENGKPFKWSSRRLRDAVAYDTYTKSEYSLLAVKEILNHASKNTAAHYLEHPLSRSQEALALAMIMRQVRADLHHVAKTGTRPGPASPTQPSVASVVPAKLPSVSMTMFGPARGWLSADAPVEVRELFGDLSGEGDQ